MAYQNLATELTFNDLQNDDVFPTSGVLTSLKKYEKFIEVYVNDQSNKFLYLKRFPRIEWLAMVLFVPGQLGRHRLCCWYSSAVDYLPMGM